MSKFQLKRFLKKSYEFSLVLLQFFIIILHFIHLEFIPKKEIMQVNFIFICVGFLLIIISTIVMLISIKDLGSNLSPFPRPIVNGNLTTSGIYIPSTTGFENVPSVKFPVNLTTTPLVLSFVSLPVAVTTNAVLLPLHA